MASDQTGAGSDKRASVSKAVRQSFIKNAKSFDSLRTVVALVAVILLGLLSPIPDRVLFSLRYHLSPDDVLSKGASAAEGPSGSDLVVIALDEAYAEQHRYPEVTPRAYLDSLVRAVAAHRPSVIALDFKFSVADLRDPAFASLCEQLTVTGADSPLFVLPTAVQKEQTWYRVLPFPPAHLRRHVLTGYANLRGEPVQGIELTRPLGPSRKSRQPESAEASETGRNAYARLPSFALSALLAHTDPAMVRRAHQSARSFRSQTSCAIDAIELDAGVSVWQEIPDNAIDDVIDRFVDDPENTHINFQGPVKAGTMNVHSAETLLRAPSVLEHLVPDKLVLIGSTYQDPEGKDTFDTVFGKMRGVEVHASILDSILQKNVLRPVSVLVTMLICLLLILAMYHVAVWMRFNLIGATVVVALLYSFVCLASLSVANILLPAGPGLAVIFCAGIFFHQNTTLWHPSMRAYARIRATCRAPIQRCYAWAQSVRQVATPPDASDSPDFTELRGYVPQTEVSYPRTEDRPLQSSPTNSSLTDPSHADVPSADTPSADTPSDQDARGDT